MPRDPIPTWFFALVVVRRENRYLLVREQKHDQLWYLPAGRVEPGEGLVEAARRETLEEAGIPVEIEGILRLEHTPWPDGARVRVIFVARPADDTPPKSTPDEHSLEARWVTLAELARYPLRSREVREWFEEVAWGAPVYPVTLLAMERE
jgi:ADP-ribose pyrophosphatase YjhB (NUDIX family)